MPCSCVALHHGTSETSETSLRPRGWAVSEETVHFELLLGVQSVAAVPLQAGGEGERGDRVLKAGSKRAKARGP